MDFGFSLGILRIPQRICEIYWFPHQLQLIIFKAINFVPGYCQVHHALKSLFSEEHLICIVCFRNKLRNAQEMHDYERNSVKYLIGKLFGRWFFSYFRMTFNYCSLGNAKIPTLLLSCLYVLLSWRCYTTSSVTHKNYYKVKIILAI